MLVDCKNDDSFIAAFRDRIRELFQYGFSTKLLIHCAHEYRDFHFDRYVSLIPNHNAVEHGDSIIRVIPCSFAIVAITYGTFSDVSSVLHIMNRSFSSVILCQADTDIWFPLAKEIQKYMFHKKSTPEQMERARKALQKSATQMLVKYIDIMEYRDTQSHLDVDGEFWLNLDDLDAHLVDPGIGIEPEEARVKLETYVMRRVEEFEKALREKPSFKREELLIVQNAIDCLIRERNQTSEWKEKNRELWTLMHLMWQIYHLSAVVVVYSDRERCVRYLDSIIRFSHEVKSFTESRGLTLNYGPNVFGTFMDHCEYIIELTDIIKKNKSFPITKSVLSIRARIHLIYYMYLYARGEKWHADHWKPIKDHLINKCNIILQRTSSEESKQAFNVVHVWYWLAVALKNLNESHPFLVDNSNHRDEQTVYWEYVQRTIEYPKNIKVVADSKSGQHLLRLIDYDMHINN